MIRDHSWHDADPVSFWRSRYAVGLLVMGAVAAYFQLSEHRAHFFWALPFLLLLACPLMHVFMHGGYGGHGAAHGDHEGGKQAPAPAAIKPGERP